jgi:hypothetical protein
MSKRFNKTPRLKDEVLKEALPVTSFNYDLLSMGVPLYTNKYSGALYAQKIPRARENVRSGGVRVGIYIERRSIEISTSQTRTPPLKDEVLKKAPSPVDDFLPALINATD